HGAETGAGTSPHCGAILVAPVRARRYPRREPRKRGSGQPATSALLHRDVLRLCAGGTLARLAAQRAELSSRGRWAGYSADPSDSTSSSETSASSIRSKSNGLTSTGWRVRSRNARLATPTTSPVTNTVLAAS